MARQILGRTVRSVGYYPICNLGNLSVITTWMLAEDRKFSSQRHRTSLLWQKRSPERHICWHQIPMPSSSTGVTGRVGDGCLNTQWSVFQGRNRELRRASAYTVSLHFVWGDITSSVKALHCKHKGECRPGRGAVRTLRSWHTHQECSRAHSGLPLMTNMCMAEAHTEHVRGMLIFFFYLSFSKICLWLTGTIV